MNKTAKSKAFTELNFSNYLKRLSKLAYVKADLIRRGVQESELVSGKIDNKFELSKTCAFFINPRQFQHLEKIIVDKEQQKIILSDMIKKGQSKIAVAEIDVIEDMDEADPPMC